MKYAHIDNNNKLLGWYDKDIHSTIPTPNIEVSDEQWQEAINKCANKINQDGSSELFDFRTEEEITEQEKQQKISGAKKYLEDTDFKMLNDYNPRSDGESLEDIKLKRYTARELIRQLE